MSEMISKGRHPAVCSGSIQFGITGSGDNAKEQVVVQFELNDDADPYRGHHITWFGFFTEKTEERTIEALRIMGWEGDDLSALPQLALDGKLSAQVELVVDHEEYEGEWQAKVRWVNRVGGAAIKLKQPLEGAALAQFAARMRGKVRAAGTPAGRTTTARPSSGNGSGARPTPHPNAPGSDTDDIPFASCALGDDPSPIARVIR